MGCEPSWNIDKTYLFANMILNLHSLAFGTETISGGGTPAWGTEMGQGTGYRFSFPNYESFITGLVYNSIPNPQNRVYCPLGKGGNQSSDYEFVVASLFHKVFVNGMPLEGKFLLLITKKLVGANHVGRRTLKYNPRMTLDGIAYNDQCFKAMAHKLNVSNNGSWFVSEINIENQDELHFTAHVLDAKNKTSFLNSEDRSKQLQAKLQANARVITSRSKFISLETAKTSADVSQFSYLRAMRTKPFLLLAGISGTGKSRIVKQMAFDSCLDVGDLRKDPTSPGNYCLIEVKPNWHDSTELLGYESKIGGAHYQLTTFVKFLAKAMLFPDVPFFVCLDEMNLAPVEQYFAEFLSVLESRTKKNGHVVSEPLIKAEIFRKYSSLEKSLFSKEEDTTAYQDSLGTVEPEAPYGKEAQVFAHLKEHGLRIPENVIIIGTVNMDETTHQFSRKVIDRAMTIEMNLPEGDPFMDFFENSSNLEYREEPSSASLYLSTEVRAADVIEILTSESEEEIESLKHQVANFLRGLNAALDKTPFQVAYRVQNELVLYFYQLWLEDKSVAWSDILTNACDQILMMKVLPRIEGDEELLEEPLKRLSEFCQPYTNASKKLIFMTERLAQSRFASFWP